MCVVEVGKCGAWCQSLAALQTDWWDGKGQLMNKGKEKKNNKKEEMMSTGFEGNKETGINQPNHHQGNRERRERG